MGRIRNYDIMPAVHSSTDGYKALAASICARAVHDYMHGLEEEKVSAKKFIMSDAFTYYSGGLDGEEVIRILNSKIQDWR